MPYIAGGLGASYDDSTWVLTSYLAANAIVLPISGWLAEIIGRKRYFMMSLCYFHGEFTALRPRAESAGIAVLSSSARHRWRWIATDGTSDSQRYVSSRAARPAFAVYGVYCGSRPYSRADAGRLDYGQLFLALDIFHYAACGSPRSLFDPHLVEDPPFLRRIKRGGIRVDYIGISMLALGVGSLQVLLDKGQEDDWFGSHFITTLVDNRNGLPDHAGHLGMVPQRSDH